MSDFEDEEGVDEPVLDDENEEEGTEEEDVSCFEHPLSFLKWILSPLHENNDK